MIKSFRRLFESARIRPPTKPTTPRVVYKYLPPERIDVLESGLLRFTPPFAFNDPFETNPFITGFLMPETRRELAARVSTSTTIVDPEFPDIAARAIDQLLAKAYQERHAEHFGNTFGILSLSARKDSLLMWAHYARSHTGLAVGFDAGNAFFAQVSSDWSKGSFRPVAYRHERPRLDHRGLLTDDVLFTKSPEWEYEMEWRAIRPLNEAHTVLPEGADGTKVHLFLVPEAARVEVVLGSRMSTHDRDRALLALSGKGDSRCRVFQARLSEHLYGLTFSEIPSA